MHVSISITNDTNVGMPRKNTKKPSNLIIRHSRILNFLSKFFSIYSQMEPWHKIPMHVYLGFASSTKMNSPWVYSYADQRGNLSFTVHVKVKWVLCYFVIVSRPVAYIEYSKTSKNIMSDGRHLLLLTLNYTVALPGLAIFSYKAILWWLWVTSFKQSTTSKPAQ